MAPIVYVCYNGEGISTHILPLLYFRSTYIVLSPIKDAVSTISYYNTFWKKNNLLYEIHMKSQRGTEILWRNPYHFRDLITN